MLKMPGKKVEEEFGMGKEKIENKLDSGKPDLKSSFATRNYLNLKEQLTSMLWNFVSGHPLLILLSCKYLKIINYYYSGIKLGQRKVSCVTS